MVSLLECKWWSLVLCPCVSMDTFCCQAFYLYPGGFVLSWFETFLILAFCFRQSVRKSTFPRATSQKNGSLDSKVIFHTEKKTRLQWEVFSFSVCVLTNNQLIKPSWRNSHEWTFLFVAQTATESAQRRLQLSRCGDKFPRNAKSGYQPPNRRRSWSIGARDSASPMPWMRSQITGTLLRSNTTFSWCLEPTLRFSLFFTMLDWTQFYKEIYSQFHGTLFEKTLQSIFWPTELHRNVEINCVVDVLNTKCELSESCARSNTEIWLRSFSIPRDSDKDSLCGFSFEDLCSVPEYKPHRCPHCPERYLWGHQLREHMKVIA